MDKEMYELYKIELRDDFALEAMRIMLLDAQYINVDEVATASYEIADAMLKAREVKNA